MDLTSMMKTMLSADSITQMSEKTGTSTDEVKSVLLSALPAMLKGVQGQANNKDTVAGFANALDSHAKDDTSDITAFLSHVDIKDGEKIVGHLLGGDKAATTKDAATKAGLSNAATGKILGAAAPLLMSLLGQQFTQAVQAQPQQQAQGVQPLGGGQQAAPSGIGLLASLLGGGQQQAPQQQSALPASGLGGLLGSLLGGAPQQQQAPQQQAPQQQSADVNPLGSMVGSMLGGADISSLLSGFLGGK